MGQIGEYSIRLAEGREIAGGETSSGTGRLLQHFFGSVADSIGVSMQLGSTEAVKRAVQAGLGISLVISSSVVDECESGRLRSVKIEGITPTKIFTLFVVAICLKIHHRHISKNFYFSRWMVCCLCQQLESVKFAVTYHDIRLNRSGV